MSELKKDLGVAGWFAKTFVNSKLTPLLIIGSLILGTFALIKTPREEEPQIVVPMADIVSTMPGATAKEVEQRLTTPLENVVWQIPGVEYVYSMSQPGKTEVIARFLVGENDENAMVRLRDKIQSNLTLLPAEASAPVITPRSINDVPIFALTLHSSTVSPEALHQLALRVADALQSVPQVAQTTVIGGPSRELLFTPDPAKLAAAGVSMNDLTSALSRLNARSSPGAISTDNDAVQLHGGSFVTSAADLESAQIPGAPGQPLIPLRSLGTIEDRAAEPTTYLTFRDHNGQPEPAVTISLAKRKGTNAIDVVANVRAKLKSLQGTLIPDNVHLTVTRDYGKTAADKVNDLLLHMGIAVVSVTALVALALGLRESLVVLVAIPVTLALTLLVFYLYGYTLNRITLFALIFSIGILVDDAIVVVENIVRHHRLAENKDRPIRDVAIEAVAEVGNPTILATLAVISAILPMAFVGGLMGPYMRPIPVGASAAMIFSLLVAFIVTPWAAIRILKNGGSHKHKESATGEPEDDALTRLYRRIMNPLLASAKLQGLFFLVVLVLLGGAISLVFTKSVIVKMLPFDNKNEFEVVVNMPTGTNLERTNAAAQSLASYLASNSNVRNVEVYSGTAAPFNFNGLVRHYFDRQYSWQADIQVNLKDASERTQQSHPIVQSLRPELARIARQWGARLQVAEVPPGPPVQSTLVAEVYGPSYANRLETAQKVKQIFLDTPGVVDVDWTVDDPQTNTQLVPDEAKAASADVSISDVAASLQTALGGTQVGIVHDPDSREVVPINIQLSRANRSTLSGLGQVPLRTANGTMIPLSQLVREQAIPTDDTRYQKNLLPVIYVTGDVSGRIDSPTYAMLAMGKKLKALTDAGLNIRWTSAPSDTTKPQMKWDGEWQITFEVFRDLGIAFAAVLVLIYMLVVAWFQDFKTPLVIMAPIPLTLIGILPAHALMGAYFTATSMIGFIAGAGIIVRNSIILVDFIELRRREGMAIKEAVIDAGATRFRPMLLTAAAVILGSSVILSDPIFQGLALALMAGEIASTLLSRFAVPILYFIFEKRDRHALP